MDEIDHNEAGRLAERLIDTIDETPGDVAFLAILLVLRTVLEEIFERTRLRRSAPSSRNWMIWPLAGSGCRGA